jgi:hypothetical protein
MARPARRITESGVGGPATRASFATVSREWHRIIETHNFAQINLKASRLAKFHSNTWRNRALVSYIWFCLELETYYECPDCGSDGDWDERSTERDENNEMVRESLRHLFAILSTWGSSGCLVLGISIYSPSDTEHWFPYLTFVPDVPNGECRRDLWAAQSTFTILGHDYHGWIDGRLTSTPSELAIRQVFERVTREACNMWEDQSNEWGGGTVASVSSDNRPSTSTKPSVMGPSGSGLASRPSPSTPRILL